jgi:hypothetical protein
MRNRRRTPGHHETIRTLRYGKGIMGWLRAYHEALLILGVFLLLGVGGGYAIRSTMEPEHLDQLLFPQEPDHVLVTYKPYVVECFKVWTESPHGNSLLMVWSDGQIWRARTDNGNTLVEWELLAHVRTGETP